MRALLLALALGLSPAAQAGEAIDLGGLVPPKQLNAEETAILFSPVDSALSSGDRTGAADVLTSIIDDPQYGPTQRIEAYNRLAPVLAELELPYAALLAHARRLAIQRSMGPELLPILELADQVGDDDVIIEVLLRSPLEGSLDGAPTITTPPEVELRLARAQLRAGEYGKALAHIQAIGGDSNVFIDAQLLKGIVLSQQEQYTTALAPLLTAQAAGAERGDAFADLMHLNVARAYYGAGNWVQAIVEYSKVRRDSRHWAQATFERAWAHFRADDMTGALAMLENHHSPFFGDFYFPEASLLRAYALFMLCKFPSAEDELDTFKQAYEPIKAQLSEADNLDGAAAFADVQAFAASDATRLPGMVLRRFAVEDRMTDSRRAYAEAQAEIATLDTYGEAAWAGTVADWLQAHQSSLAKAEGERVLTAAKAADKELSDMLGGLEITRLDILRFETKMYEKAAATGVLDYGDQIGKLRKIRRNRRQRVWPFQGEYWADELGWFRVDTRPDCPQDMTGG